MTQFAPGLIIEILLILLLVVTVGYCMLLNQRLSRLRSSQNDLRQIIIELSAATQTAEIAIRGLRNTTEEADSRLTDKLHKAQLLVRQLSSLTGDKQPLEAPSAPSASNGPSESAQKTAPDPETWRKIAMSRLKKAS